MYKFKLLRAKVLIMAVLLACSTEILSNDKIDCKTMKNSAEHYFEIQLELPYVASDVRRNQIETGYLKLGIGQPEDKVIQILGDPDARRPLYSTNIASPKIIGFTLWYILERRSDTGSFNDKGEKLVRVSFDLLGRTIALDSW